MFQVLRCVFAWLLLVRANVKFTNKFPRRVRRSGCLSFVIFLTVCACQSWMCARVVSKPVNWSYMLEARLVRQLTWLQYSTVQTITMVWCRANYHFFGNIVSSLTHTKIVNRKSRHSKRRMTLSHKIFDTIDLFGCCCGLFIMFGQNNNMDNNPNIFDPKNPLLGRLP